jgi:hypothetical protein
MYASNLLAQVDRELRVGMWREGERKEDVEGQKVRGRSEKGTFFRPGDRGNCFAPKHHAIAGLCAFNADIMGADE